MKKLVLALLATMMTGACLLAAEAALEGFYAGAFGGVNFEHYKNTETLKISMRPGYALGIAGGYKFNQRECVLLENTRIEAEFAYRHNKISRVRYMNYYLPFSGHSESASGLLNILYDLRFCDFNVYLGGGMGYAAVRTKVTGYNITHKIKDNGFCWQGIFGVGYSFCNATELDLEYRFFDVKDHAYNQVIAIGLKRYF